MHLSLSFELVMDYIKELFHQSYGKASKSSILMIFGWLFVASLAACGTSFATHAPEWFSMCLTGVLMVILLSILIAFFYCLFTNNTDPLRSESFTIQKLAIEKGFSGDSLLGVSRDDTKSLINVAVSSSVVDEENEDDK